MKLTRALEILTLSTDSVTEQDDVDYEEAQKLAFHSLNAVINTRSNNYYTPIPLLPGETPENHPRPDFAGKKV